MNWICVCMFCLLIIFVLSDSQKHTNERTFIIDYEKNEFLKDGQVFRYVSGSLHYFRVPQQYWKDRIQKYKAAGLNAITTYVEWSLHEPYPGIYNFEGIADLEYFLKLIKDENMYLLLRPGPYICAERDFGGFPYWLLNVTPKNSLRTNNLSYTKYVSKWFSVLMPKIQPYLYGNGGNIIMVQVENEYGSYYACDSEYKLWLRDLFRSYVQNNAVLYTTDGCGESYVHCGSIPEVYATVDFGIGSNASECFNFTKMVQNGGPLVNSEFYPGWLSHWQEPLAVVPSNDVVNQVKIMLAMNASFNFYMFHGGTNFGFTSGANTNDTKSSVGYLAQLTSYDYNAPLDEAGDPTEKYFKIKHALKKANYLDTNYISPIPAPKGAYGKFNLQPLVSIFEKAAQRIKPVVSMVPLPFEDMDINTGFVIYETSLKNIQMNHTNPIILNVTSVRDRAIIYLDQLQVGIMSRLKGNTTISLNINNSIQTLSILVENQGRINYGDFLEDRKGISGTVSLGDQVLSPWKMIAYPLNETAWFSSITPSKNVQLPAFYKTQFMLPENYSTCLDTYLDTSGWTKGVAFLNEINLGRYWPIGGPQVTLYVPAAFLKPPPSINTLVMLELENAPQDLAVQFIDYPILDGPISGPRLSK
ncbi:Glycoside hydrolase superfamily,Beta-galactosidase 1-like,Glycoside hydrolase, family [Cinara cedri]|uniref:Glycoside hydrolase superfamily,Beta-galactosidase 1-like,Glycoside hydrolase, family n=1 Tax=Cinara cedri TaxID=506608 RepID=A0A5E4MJ12_9HEMI|nr:Glycoside hydrolase superfamily,Beta-galactosidase 1-like,Glycoside hydrolase, family [Cinara cedri]